MSLPLYDVAIVGFGPTGALLANLLGASGLSVVVLEREAAPYPLPRAVHFDGEVMRGFQAAGLANEVQAVARASSKGMHFVDGNGRTLLIRQATEGAGPQGWASNYYMHQPNLEGVLREGVRRFSNVSIRLRHDVFAIDVDAKGATIRVEDTSCGALSSIHARYVVGCDGARSLVRRLIGSTMEDLGLHQPWLVVDLLVDPNSERVRALPEYTVQHCDPARPMTAVYIGGNRRRWEIMVMPGDEPAAMAEPDRLWPILSRWIGPTDATIERSALYTFHSVIARGWRRGPLLLAGDSCHQTPPFLGQGMCAGMRDVVNLAWKLDLVVKGRAPDVLLDTYETERRPHVHAFIKLAVDLGAIIQATEPEAVAKRDRSFTGGAPELFNFPLPQLGPGARADSSVPVGQVFPQPRLDDGRLLDEVIGGKFALLSTPTATLLASGTIRNDLHHLGIVTMTEPSAGLAHWLAQAGVTAVIVRPDGYIFGVVASDADLIGHITLLKQILRSSDRPAAAAAAAHTLAKRN